MATINVTAKDPSTEREVTVAYNFGDNIADAIAKFGEDVVFAAFVADAKVGLQAAIRTKLRAKKEDESSYTDAEVIEAASTWVPGAKTRTAADPMAKLQALLGKLTPEQKAALLESAL